MADLIGGNPNGSWLMFLQDDQPISGGLVANGWILSLATADFVGTAADLELLMTTTNSTVFVGQTATFVLTVTNYGPSISTNISIVDDLPLTATIIGTNVTLGSVTRSGSSLIWNVGTLNVGSGAALTVTVQPHGTGVLVNSANANAGTPDPNSDEDTASATVSIAQLTSTWCAYMSNGVFHISIPGPTNASLTVVVPGQQQSGEHELGQHLHRYAAHQLHRPGGEQFDESLLPRAVDAVIGPSLCACVQARTQA